MKYFNVSKLTTFVIFVVLIFYTELTKCIEADEIAASQEQPPLVFPEDNTKYKIIPNNDTILRTLTHANNSNSTSEIYDMLHTPFVEETLRNSDAVEEKNNSDESLKVLKLDDSKWDTELIQETNAPVQKDTFMSHDFAHHTGMWVLASIVFIFVLSSIVYLGIVMWRKTFGIKYGRRQILINEEDPPNDYKHSEL